MIQLASGDEALVVSDEHGRAIAASGHGSFWAWRFWAWRFWARQFSGTLESGWLPRGSVTFSPCTGSPARASHLADLRS